MVEDNKKSKNISDDQKSNSTSESMPPLNLKLKNSDQKSAPEGLIIKTESDNNQKIEPKNRPQSLCVPEEESRRGSSVGDHVGDCIR